MFNSTKSTLNSDVNQNIYGKVTKHQENTTHKRDKGSALFKQATTRLAARNR